MDYSLFITSTAAFIETRLKEPIEYAELENTVGFSYRHIRETFKECTGVSLSRYILLRRLANSAFEIVHTAKSLTEIAADYAFESYDTFTRAFKRHCGCNPSDLKRSSCRVRVGRKRIAIGVIAPVIMNNDVNPVLPTVIPEVMNTMENIQKTEQSCILYGVPKVAYSYEGGTPFCVALKACLNYMGQNIDYTYIMAITGAAFRLRWNTRFWDGGNVDIMNIYEDRYEAFKRIFRAAGRSYRILKRENSGKEEFKQFIKSEIDEGRPVIAFGIIGPPEACLITGYQSNGDTLLGWNCFQENQEFAVNVTFHETGYFICSNWWENECTLALISVGERQEELVSKKEILTNAVDILTREKVIFCGKDGKVTAEYAGGQAAYELWAKSITDDREFPSNAVLPLLLERIVCQNDAQCMVGEGRYYASCFMEQLGRENEKLSEKCTKAVGYFRKAAECAMQMDEPKGGFMQDEQTTRKFAEPGVRKQIAQLIRKAKENEAKACELVKEIAEEL